MFSNRHSSYVLLVALLPIGSACAESTDAVRMGPSGCRVALLVGNAKYNDANLNGVTTSLDCVERACKEQGFRVTRYENLDKKTLQNTIETYADTVPTNGVALIYYHGLGAHIERFGKYENLLRPIGASIDNENDYRLQGFNLNDLVKLLDERSGARRNLVFLDACWDSPIKPETDKVHGGFHEIEVPNNVTVVFAAESGKTFPLPEDADVSPLAQALAGNLQRFNDSIQTGCESLGSGWSGGVVDTGLGPLSTLPVAETLREGSRASEGYVNSLGMVLRWCPPGSFQMGSEQADSPSTRDRKPVHVTLTQGYWMGEYEVTQREYYLVMRKNVPVGFTKHNNAPFWGVSEAKSVHDFCKKLTELERKAGSLSVGWEYVCPTEAEWEYACRAGSTSAYCFGDTVADLGVYANFADRALREENPNNSWADPRSDDGVGEALALVGSYRPNAWGLRDMHGNVAELVADHLSPTLPGGKDPLVQVKNDAQAVIRGGAWCSLPLYCESSFRNALSSRDKLTYVGFRIALKKTQ